MAFEALSFIHAAGVLIDHQLRDVAGVSRGMRSTLLEATTTSFERIVEACVEHEVDFLLLTGDTFDERDRSLRARVVLRDGLSCLQDAGIQVFVVPGAADPASAWQSIPDLPDNVTLFAPEVDEPTAVMRDGNVIATLQGCLDDVHSHSRSVRRDGDDGESHDDDGESHGEVGQSRIAPFKIGIIPQSGSSSAPSEAAIDRWLQKFSVDYLAVPRPSRRLWRRAPERLAHCPGPATSMTRDDVGAHGCTMFTIANRNQATQHLLATSPVRREQPEIELDETDTWDLLIAAMRRVIDGFEGLDQTSVLMIDWQISGSGSLFDALANPESESELFELLGIDGSLGSIDSVTQRVVRVGAGADRTASRTKNPLLSGFLGRLEHSPSVVRSVVNRVSTAPGQTNSVWPARLTELAARVSHAAVAAAARRRGIELFGQLCPDTIGDEFETGDSHAAEADEPFDSFGHGASQAGNAA